MALLESNLKPILFYYFLQGSPIRFCHVAIHNGNIKIVVIPPHPGHLDRLVQDGQQYQHKGLRSRPVPFEPAHSTYANIHNYTYRSPQHQSSLHDPTHLGSPSDLTNWLVDTGATSHMPPSLTDLTYVENGPYLSVEVYDGPTVPCKGKCIATLNITDDDGDSITLVLQNVIYAPGLTRGLFSVVQFTSKYNSKAHIERNCITLTYHMATAI
jgi:hypothetical protein